MSEEAKKIRKLIISHIEKEDNNDELYRDNPDFYLGYRHGVNTVVKLLMEVFNGEQ